MDQPPPIPVGTIPHSLICTARMAMFLFQQVDIGRTDEIIQSMYVGKHYMNICMN